LGCVCVDEVGEANNAFIVAWRRGAGAVVLETEDCGVLEGELGVGEGGGGVGGEGECVVGVEYALHDLAIAGVDVLASFVLGVGGGGEERRVGEGGRDCQIAGPRVEEKG